MRSASLPRRKVSEEEHVKQSNNNNNNPAAATAAVANGAAAAPAFPIPGANFGMGALLFQLGPPVFTRPKINNHDLMMSFLSANTRVHEVSP